MIFWMPKNQDTLDGWSIVHFIGGIAIAAGLILLKAWPIFILTGGLLGGFLYECRDAWYANVANELKCYGRFILGRRLGARYNSTRLYGIIFWMADRRGASALDIILTSGGGACVSLVYWLLCRFLHS
jgi:hypothetical protein